MDGGQAGRESGTVVRGEGGEKEDEQDEAVFTSVVGECELGQAGRYGVSCVRVDLGDGGAKTYISRGRRRSLQVLLLSAPARH